MSSRANHFKLGLFVITGLVAGLAALVFLGANRLVHEPTLIETYLDQSVQGLDVGSKVKYRGVTIGSVHAIDFTRTRYETHLPPEDRKRYILIDIALDQEMLDRFGEEDFERVLKEEVEGGLRFRLNAQGITGLSYLELDYVDVSRSPSLEITWRPEHLYIPSAPGTLTKLLSSFEAVFRKLEAVDLGLVLTNLNRLLTTTEAEIRGAQIAQISQQATNLLAELRGSNRALRGILEDPKWRELPGSAAGVLEGVRAKIERLDLDGVVSRAERVLAGAETLVAGKDADLTATLANLRALTENLRAVSEAVRANPSGLLFGAPPSGVQPAGGAKGDRR